jgi:hypothetical protein
MSRTKKRLFVSALVVLQLALLSAVGYFAIHAWTWKMQAIDAIASNAVSNATRDYRRGMRRLFEVKTINTNAHEYSGRSYNLYEQIPANRREGSFDVWFVVIPSSSFAEQAAIYIENYNRAMRVRVEKPELFDSAGERKPRDQENPKTNPTERGNV